MYIILSFDSRQRARIMISGKDCCNIRVKVLKFDTRDMQRTVWLIRVALIVTLGVFVASNVMQLYLGAWLYNNYSFLSVILPMFYIFPSFVTLGSASFVLLLTFYSLVAVSMRSSVYVRTLRYALILIGLVIAMQVFAYMIIYMFEDNADDTLRRSLSDAMFKSGNDIAVSRTIDTLQREYRCCGVYSHRDWYIGGENSIPPRSCCVNNATMGDVFVAGRGLDTNCTTYHRNGCLGTFEDMVRHMTYQCRYALPLVVMQTVVVAIGLILSRELYHFQCLLDDGIREQDRRNIDNFISYRRFKGRSKLYHQASGDDDEEEIH